MSSRACHRPPRRYAVFIALCVLFWRIAAPSFAHAFVESNRGIAWDEICTATGLVRLAASALEPGAADADASNPKPVERRAVHAADCPACQAGAGTCVPPSAAFAWSATVFARFALVAAADVVDRDLHSYWRPPARAPPVLGLL